MEYSLEDFLAAITGFHEMLMEDEECQHVAIMDKNQFMHLVIDALSTMCECGLCDAEDSDKVVEWQLAMMSLFGNLDDVDITIAGDGTTNVYTARHKDGKKAVVECPREKITSAGDQEAYMIQAMEKLAVQIQE